MASDHKPKHTNDYADMSRRLLTQQGEVIRVSKNTARAINRRLKRKAESPVLIFEKDGHLQFCPFNIPSSLGIRMRGPHLLRNHCSSNHDAAIK
jgi:hypothetical protein